MGWPLVYQRERVHNKAMEKNYRVTKGKMQLQYLSPPWPSMDRVRNWWNQSRRSSSNRNEKVVDFVTYIDGVTDVCIGRNTAFISRICICVCMCKCSCGTFTTKYISLCKSVSSQQHLTFFYSVCIHSKVRFQIHGLSQPLSIT